MEGERIQDHAAAARPHHCRCLGRNPRRHRADLVGRTVVRIQVDSERRLRGLRRRYLPLARGAKVDVPVDAACYSDRKLVEGSPTGVRLLRSTESASNPADGIAKSHSPAPIAPPQNECLGHKYLISQQLP